MRKFNVTVNGKTYEVEVEEIGGLPSPTKVAPVSTPKVNAPAPVAPAPQIVEQTKPSAPISGGEKVTAPMPGKVLRIVKTEGNIVKAGEVVLILEAMKMENEITAPIDGSIKQMATHEGAAVNPGDVLFVIG
ncbi:MAG: acetyl-CoA carboxylase biotin carboxyl carrier protein subunit [Clostridia bacterium]|nr:acetyl-CoA carboxylase biotin carboxyl carrier protein subunit [Clostridia bacterium]